MDAAGVPLQRHTVALATKGTPFLDTHVTSVDGGFRFAVPHGQYELRVEGVWLLSSAVKLIDARNVDAIEFGVLAMEEIPEPELRSLRSQWSRLLKPD